jgi:WD40 repeat protein
MIYLDGCKQDVDALTFSPDGRELAVGGSASHVQLWDLDRRKTQAVLGPNGPHRAVMFLGGDYLLTATGSGNVRLSARPFTQVANREAPGITYLHAAPTVDGWAVVLVGQLNYGPYMECWELPDLRGLRWQGGGEGGPYGTPFRVCPCPDGKMVCGRLRDACLLDPQTGGLGRHITSHPEAVPALAVSPDGALLAVAAGAQLSVCEMATGRRRGTVRSQGRKHFTDVAFHPSGKVLAASSNHETVRLFDAATLAEVAAYDWEVGPVRRLAFAPDGQRAAAAGKTGRVVVWDVEL